VTGETVTTAGSDSTTAADQDDRDDPEIGGRTSVVRRSRLRKMNRCLVVNPDESPMFYWITLTAFAVLYNLWACIAREAFPEFQSSFETIWLMLDLLSDVVYLVDIVVQFRTGYLERGLIVYDSAKLALHYVRSSNFVLDVLSLAPLDYALKPYIATHPLIRFPRFLKSFNADANFVK